LLLRRPLLFLKEESSASPHHRDRDLPQQLDFAEFEPKIVYLALSNMPV